MFTVSEGTVVRWRNFRAAAMAAAGASATNYR